MRLHLTALIVIPGCVALCVWQVDRALGGNELSWAYVFEWPAFAAYGVFVWWKLVHERPDEEQPAAAVVASTAAAAAGPDRGSPAPSAGAATSAAAPGEAAGPAAAGPAAASAGAGPDSGAEPEGGAGGADEELAAYNRYLAELDASGIRKRW